MSLPKELSEPLTKFWNQYNWIIIVVVICIIVGYASVAFLGKNNPIELEVEKVIEVETGVRVDLTP